MTKEKRCQKNPKEQQHEYIFKRLLTFLLFAVSDFLAFVAIYIPYTYLPPLALAHNILPGIVHITIN